MTFTFFRVSNRTLFEDLLSEDESESVDWLGFGLLFSVAEMMRFESSHAPLLNISEIKF